MLDALPQARSLTGDRGYDSDWLRNALIEKGIGPCIPPKRNRKVQHDYDKALYKKRHKIETASDGSRTGGGSQHATIAALTPSSQLSTSQQASSSIRANES